MASGRQDMINLAWRRLIDTYLDPQQSGFYESRPRRPGDPVWAYNWGFGALLACAGAICQSGQANILTDSDWEALRQGLLGYQRRRIGFASTTRLRNVHLGDAFYDDNAWIGLACLDLAGSDRFFDQAPTIYRFLLQGRDPKRGGIFWKERPRASLHVCSTGPTAVMAARLYRMEPSTVDLKPVRAMMTWLDRMRSPDGRYWDNETVGNGSIEVALHTYNTGTPLWAMALLEGLPGFSFREAVALSLLALPQFLTDSGDLPRKPWFNVVLLRAILAVNQTYRLPSSLLTVYTQAMEEAWGRFLRDGGVLNLPSQDSQGGIMLRDAAASVETLVLLSQG